MRHHHPTGDHAALWLMAVTVAALLLSAVATAEGVEKKRKKKWRIYPDDPYVAFVPNRPWLVATERREGTVLLLRYPELEVEQTFETPSDEKLLTVRSYGDGRWLAGFFGDDSLRVWDVTRGELALTVDPASRAFAFHPEEARLVVWQPEIGITQWALETGERVGPVISSLHHVFLGYMLLSSDGRYLLIYGRCWDQKVWRDFCVYDLQDGATVAATDIEMRDPRFVHWMSPRSKGGPPFENAKEFLEILRATRFEDSGRSSACTRLDAKQALCCAGGVALVEPEASPVSPAASATHAFPGRYVWEIRPGMKRIGARVLNSCALSADRRWVAVGAEGREVLLFDTRDLEEKEMGMFGLSLDSWRQPSLVRRFEMP